MKQKLIKVGCLVVVALFSLLIYENIKLKNSLLDSNEEKINIKKGTFTNRLSMMLENEAGDYVASTAEEWPSAGYKFNSKLSKCENGGKVSWDYDNKRIKMSGVSTDKCYIYFDKIVTVDSYCTSGDNLADCIKTYGNQGYDKSSIYIHNSSLVNGAGDNSIRFAGPNEYVNNYVCFGSDASVCPSDNLYRIIGVFGDKVKLIKADFASSNLLGADGDYSSDNRYTWNYKNNTSLNYGYGSNIWSTSLLNSINLNTNYLNNIGSTWVNAIAQTTWKVGGNTGTNIMATPMYQTYQKEIVTPASSETYNAKIGLMYVSDYGYAASQKYWAYPGYDSNGGWSNNLWTGVDYTNAIRYNWMFLGSDWEWTITRSSGTSTDAFRIDTMGAVTNGAGVTSHKIRPTFYLKSSIKYGSGKGTKENPIKLKIETLATYVKSQYTGTQGENGIYLHNSSLTNGAGDNSYRYAGGDYSLTTKAVNAGYNLQEGVVNFYCNGYQKYLSFRCDISQTHYYTLKYDTTNTQYQTYSEALTKAMSDGYLTNNNIKNYVCFGSNANTCPTDNLYRIIGVFGDQVKLIKADYATNEQVGSNGEYYQEYSYFFSGKQGINTGNNPMFHWDNTNKANVWANTALNTINLNTNYLNNIGSEWSNKISSSLWEVSGNTIENLEYVAMYEIYQNEIVLPVQSTKHQAKIGLMYVSDYGYSATPNYWTYFGYSTTDYTTDYRNARNNNWLYAGVWEWTITRRTDVNGNIIYIGSEGELSNAGAQNFASIRPCFYLNTNILYLDGTGEINDPIIIS